MTFIILEILATIFVLIGVWLISTPNIIGLWLMLAAQICWCFIAIKANLWGLALQSLVLFFINIRGIINWTQKKVG